jgi:hypothetical protein
MKAPKDSLDDFIVSPPKPSEPPAMRSVRATGRSKVLMPLTTEADLARSREIANGRWVRRLSWFHRSLIVTGAFAFLVFLASSLYIGIYGPSVETVSNEFGRSRKGSVPPKDPGPFGRILPDNSPAADDDTTIVVSTVARSRKSRPHAELAVYRQRHPAHRRPKFVMSKFVPTTLVIYAENGQIKTRIEPQLTAGYKKPTTFPN